MITVIISGILLALSALIFAIKPIKTELVERKPFNRSLIGKQYVVQDNSYNTIIGYTRYTNLKINTTLSPCPANDYKVIPLTIVSEPFKCKIVTVTDKIKEIDVIVVENEEMTFIVMYHKEGIINETNTLEMIIEKNKRRANGYSFMTYPDFK